MVNKESPIIIQPYLAYKITIILLGSILVIISSLIAFIPGRTFDIIALGGYIISVYGYASIFYSQLRYENGRLKKRTLMGTDGLEIDKVKEISKVKMFGTVGEVPVSFSKIKFRMEDGETKELSLRRFRYEIVYDLLEKLDLLPKQQ